MENINSKASKMGFNLKIIFTGRFSPLRPLFWIFKHKNVFPSVPILRRKVFLLVKSSINKVNTLKLRRNAIYKSSFLVVKKIGDRFILTLLPQKLVRGYMIYSPFFSESFSLIPYLYIYSNISDEKFYHLHTTFGLYRMLYQGNMPVRLGLTVLSDWIPDLILKSIQPMPDSVFKFFFPKNFNIFRLNRKALLIVALLGEIFGETYSSKQVLFNNKAVTLKVAQHSVRTEFLENLRDQQKQNPIVLNPMMYYELMPPSDCILEATLEEQEETKKLDTTEILRLRSEIQAKNMADSIKRIALF